MSIRYWTHRNCGGRIVWDSDGGFCTKCEARGLFKDDLWPPSGGRFGG